MLLSTMLRPGDVDQLASAFGVNLGGISEGERRVGRFATELVTQKVRAVEGYVGSGILRAPTDFTMLGFASERTYFDLNFNHRRDSGELAGVGVWGVMPFGRGMVMVMGNMHTLELVPQPLTDNIVKALLTTAGR